MASTFAQIQASIADKLTRTDLTTQIATEINRAIIWYSDREFWFNQHVWGSTIIPNIESYTLNSLSISDCSLIKRINLIVSSSYTPEVLKSNFNIVKDYNQFGSTGYVGQPDIFAEYNLSVYFSPIPNKTYSIDIQGTQIPATLSASGDTNNFLVYAESMIENRVKAQIYSEYLQDPEKAMGSQVVADTYEKSLDNRTRNISTRGRVRGNAI